MAFDLPSFLRSLHIIFAALWFGGATMMAFVLGPSLRAAGPAAGPFMLTVMRRGGLSPYFMSIGGLTVLLGLYLYGEFRYHEAPFGSGNNIAITIAAIIGVLTLLKGLILMMPNERKMRALAKSIPAGTPPTPQQGQQLAALGEKQGKMSGISAILIIVVFLLMTLARQF